MTASAEPDTPEADTGGFLAPPRGSRPVDHCQRCGAETPAGQGLCEEHNPRRLRGPSATQMHATVFIGIAFGIVGFFVLAAFLSGRTGPYDAAVTSTRVGPDGSVALAFTVANAGENEGVADCRVTRDGVPRPDDLAFRTERVAGGQTLLVERSVPAPPADSVAYVTDLMTVICS